MAPEPAIQTSILYVQMMKEELNHFLLWSSSGCFFLVNHSLQSNAESFIFVTSLVMEPIVQVSPSTRGLKPTDRCSSHIVAMTEPSLTPTEHSYLSSQPYLPFLPSQPLGAISLGSRRFKHTLFISFGNLCYFCLEHSFGDFLHISTFHR